MSKIEAAASLFGSSDSGSDFFTAPDGAESARDSPSGEADRTIDGQDPHGQDPSSLFDSAIASQESASSLFSDQSGEGDSSLFSGAVNHAFEDQDQAHPHPETDTQPNANAYAYSQEPYTNGNYEAANYSTLR